MSAADWTFASRFVVLPAENIDTDQIIPARFLTTTSRDGLGPVAFNDWRYTADGAPNPEFPLNRPDAAGVINDEYFDVRIFDDDDHELPRGTDGEIVIRPKRPHVMFEVWGGTPWDSGSSRVNPLRYY